jgi:hypothetical protein
MFYKKLLFIIVIALMLNLTSCRMPDNWGFHQPFSLITTAPDGPPEYKAGWHDGCQSAMGFNNFANGGIYKTKKGANFGNGIYQHDPAYQVAWGQGYMGCYTYIAGFINGTGNGRGFYQHSPLE